MCLRWIDIGRQQLVAFLLYEEIGPSTANSELVGSSHPAPATSSATLFQQRSRERAPFLQHTPRRVGWPPRSPWRMPEAHSGYIRVGQVVLLPRLR